MIKGINTGAIMEHMRAEHVAPIAKLLGITPNELYGIGGGAEKLNCWGMNKSKLYEDIWRRCDALIPDAWADELDPELFKEAIYSGLQDYTLTYSAAVLPE